MSVAEVIISKIPTLNIGGAMSAMTIEMVQIGTT
jgi:hypothetical protein